MTPSYFDAYNLLLPQQTACEYETAITCCYNSDKDHYKNQLSLNLPLQTPQCIKLSGFPLQPEFNSIQSSARTLCWHYNCTQQFQVEANVLKLNRTMWKCAEYITTLKNLQQNDSALISHFLWSDFLKHAFYSIFKMQ